MMFQNLSLAKEILLILLNLKSELYASDFESNASGMTNSTTFTDDNGNDITWNYGNIDFKELSEGPDNCASGDMCWGTNIYDSDYTDDYETSRT